MPEPEEKKVIVKMVLCPDCGKETEFSRDNRRCQHCDFPLSTHIDLERVRKVREKAAKGNAEGKEKKGEEKKGGFHPLNPDLFD